MGFNTAVPGIVRVQSSGSGKSAADHIIWYTRSAAKFHIESIYRRYIKLEYDINIFNTNGIIFDVYIKYLVDTFIFWPLLG